MPFTPAHAVAALPFGRVRAFPFEAMVIGTMAPDLPLFFPRLAPHYHVTHAFSLASLSNLPYALALLFAWQWAKPALLALFPEHVRRRLHAYARPHWPRTARALCCAALAIMLGVFTHVVWDSFTHQHRPGVILFPVLAQPWAFGLAGYKLLQYGCGVLGTLVLLLYAAARLRSQPVGPDLPRVWLEPVRKAQLAVLALAPLPSIVYGLSETLRWNKSGVLSHDFAHDVVAGSLSTLLIVCAAQRALFTLDPLRTDARE